MAEHFWPSVYPGLVVGLLYGQAMGGRLALLFGAIGGFAGAFAAVIFTPAIALPTGTLGELLSLALLITMAAVGAALAVGILRALARPPRPQKS